MYVCVSVVCTTVSIILFRTVVCDSLTQRATASLGLVYPKLCVCVRRVCCFCQSTRRPLPRHPAPVHVLYTHRGISHRALQAHVLAFSPLRRHRSYHQNNDSYINVYIHNTHIARTTEARNTYTLSYTQAPAKAAAARIHIQPASYWLCRVSSATIELFLNLSENVTQDQLIQSAAE